MCVAKIKRGRERERERIRKLVSEECTFRLEVLLKEKSLTKWRALSLSLSRSAFDENNQKS